MTRLLIADDHPLYRLALTQAVRGVLPEAVITEAEDLPGVQAALAGHPDTDLVLLDLHMPGSHGLVGLASLRAEHPGVAVAMISAHEDPATIRRALAYGAAGYLTKDRTPEALIEAVTRVARGGRFITRALAERLAGSLDGDFSAPLHDKLSDREMEVLLLLGAGNTVTAAASALRLSVKTVSTFRVRLMAKMGFTNNADIVQYVLRHHLLRPEAL